METPRKRNSWLLPYLFTCGNQIFCFKKILFTTNFVEFKYNRSWPSKYFKNISGLNITFFIGIYNFSKNIEAQMKIH